MADTVRSLQLEHASVAETLQAITSGAVGGVAGVASAGLTLVIGRRVENRAATDKRTADLDDIQTALGEGPCLDSIRDEHTVAVPDMVTDARWPRFAAAAVDLGIRSSLSFRLFIAEDTLGSLNLYASTTQAFDEESEELGLIFATHAAIALVGAQREAQMTLALGSRDLIGQAKGIVMATYDLDAVRAFAVLTRISQHTNTRLIDVARTISETRRLPTTDN